MYEAFYGLRERPFNLTPDPKYLYLSDKHKEAFAHLLYGIKNRSGFVMISGEIGTGKTTLCRNMLSQMDANTEVAFIFNPFLNPIELLKKINREFGIVSDADNILALTEELNVHLLHAAAHGKNSVLVIDEAQNLEPQVLEQIRLLSNLETDTEKLLQIILIGQPELAEKLALRELRQLNQRITARYHLKPLNALETLQYIAYRIHVAGGRKRLNFTKGAIKTVYRRSGGVPRMINALCDRALLIGYTKEQHVITARIIRQAAREIRGDKFTAPNQSRLNWRRWAPSPSLAVFVLLLLVVGHYLVDPLDRFARELSVFNRILSGEALVVSPDDEGRPNPQATADIVDTGENARREIPAEGLGALELVMERLHGSATARPSQSLARVFTELDKRDTLHAGVDALVALWNHSLAGDYPKDFSVGAVIQYFQDHGLACEYLNPNTEQLFAINVPGLVRLVAGGNSVWMSILRTDDENVTLLADNNRRLTVSHEEFDMYFGREFLVPWKDPLPDSPVLLPGQRGARVRYFKEQLHALGKLDEADINDVYDKRTEDIVIAIQTEAGLAKDGKAGPQVRLTLNSWEGNTPSLRRGINRTARSAFSPQGPVNQTASSSTVAVTPPVHARPPSNTAPNVVVAAPANVPPTEDAGTTLQDFQALAEDLPRMDMALPDFSALTAPSNSGEVASEANNQTGEREIFRLLRTRTEDAHNDSEANNNSSLMEVRELPEPFSPPPSERFELRSGESVTPPVFGSTPLTPREESAL